MPSREWSGVVKLSQQSKVMLTVFKRAREDSLATRRMRTQMGSTCELTCQSEFYVSRVRVFMSSFWGLLRMLHLTRNTK